MPCNCKTQIYTTSRGTTWENQSISSMFHDCYNNVIYIIFCISDSRHFQLGNDDDDDDEDDDDDNDQNDDDNDDDDDESKKTMKQMK